MKKILVLTASLLIASNAFAADIVTIASTIQDDVSNHAASVIHNQGSDFNTTQKELSLKIETLSKVADKSELKQELANLKDTLSETDVIHNLRETLKLELQSEPTSEELMKTYFELKALGKI